MGKMDNLEFVDLREELEKNHIAWDSPACCSSKESSYSLLRAQIQGTFQFSRDGVWIKDSEHDKNALACYVWQSKKAVIWFCFLNTAFLTRFYGVSFRMNRCGRKTGSCGFCRVKG